MEISEYDARERLIRIETLVEGLDRKLDKHLERHYQLGVKTFFALIGAGFSLLISILK
jgi:hypothetical protein